MGRSKIMSIFVLAGCMAVVALVSAFAGYSIAMRAVAGGEAVTLQDGGAEPPVGEPADAASEVVSVAASASPPVRIIEPLPDTSNTIAIPGFKRLTAEGQTLKADAITNPEQNACYFVVTLIMPGGAELYRSSYLAPGQSLGDVEMLVTLAAKTYKDVTARYSCFTMDELKPLKGADITFTLEVLP
jgi:hypothetical protein